MPIPNNGTIEDVINLLNQTQGINQKVELAEVIGEPAQSTDNISTQIGILSDGKNSIVQAINDKGAVASNTDPFIDLATAILTIPSNNIKFRISTSTTSDTQSTFEYAGSTTTVNLRTIEVSDLDFKPDLIVACSASTSTGNTIYDNLSLGAYPDSVKIFNSNQTTLTSQTVQQFKANARSGYVNSTGFKIPLGTTLSSGSTVNWIAIGGLI